MEIREIERHKFIKLIEYALKKGHFSVEQACEATGMSEGEFNEAEFIFFQRRHERIQDSRRNVVFKWELVPEAFFNYLSFLQYRDAVKSAKRAHYTAIVAIIISAGLALASLIEKLLS